ncbi:carbohydrate porin [Acidiphilium sp. AL]|nr:carbohydrate porin [Acidiphilium sp. AL]
MLNGTFPGRSHDSAAFAISYDRISARKISLIRAENALGGADRPIPSAEMDFELDYTARVTPWLTATPDLQYILHLGGGIPDPQDRIKVEPNAVLAQAEFIIMFLLSAWLGRIASGPLEKSSPLTRYEPESREPGRTMQAEWAIRSCSDPLSTKFQ